MAIDTGTRVGPKPSRAYRGADASTDSWKRRAACDITKGQVIDPEAFFPTNERGPIDPAVARLCLGCPVRVECLEDALRLGDDWSIRAGTLPRHRREIREARKCRTPSIA